MCLCCRNWETVADLGLESRILGRSAVNGVLEGRHYNRAVRIHKIVLEALLRLNWQAFLKTAQRHTQIQIEHVQHAVRRVREGLAADTIQQLYDMPELKEVHSNFEEFNSSFVNNMSVFWQ